HPYRGKRNEPKYVNLVLQEVSLLKKMSEKETAQIICNNADDIFGW
ncbi:MAG: TatD family hydrolase, partial [Finegoldia magna]|nr:TatD family hydrolase [Finegoldia magna]